MTEGHAQPGVILVAEDNNADIFLIETCVKERGIGNELRVVNDGEQAVEFIDRCDADENSQPPALVLLDLNLPKVDGQEILDRLRSSARCKAVPTIVMTSSDSPRDREDAAELGAYAYFHKPAELDDFMRLGELVEEAIFRPL